MLFTTDLLPKEKNEFLIQPCSTVEGDYMFVMPLLWDLAQSALGLTDLLTQEGEAQRKSQEGEDITISS